MCYDLINNNDAHFLENTGVTWKDHTKIKMSLYGGMSAILPFFYILSPLHLKNLYVINF